jgi:hypothetical protein
MANTNRLVPCLESIITLNKSALAENILLAQEVVKNNHKSEGKPRFTIKADLMKAYDSVDWEFLLYCLE